MDPVDWGPQFWKDFHRYARKYPVKAGPAAQQRARAWYDDVTRRLPCGSCAAKYEALFGCAMPLTAEILRSRDALFEWTVTIHNMVNVLLKKPVFDLEEARRAHD